jgi:hypothetical protein
MADRTPATAGESPRLVTVRDHSQPVGADSGAELEAAIARLTRALATADDDAIGELVAERRAMRAELETVRLMNSRNVVKLASRRREDV